MKRALNKLHDKSLCRATSSTTKVFVARQAPRQRSLSRDKLHDKGLCRTTSSTTKVFVARQAPRQKSLSRDKRLLLTNNTSHASAISVFTFAIFGLGPFKARRPRVPGFQKTTQHGTHARSVGKIFRRGKGEDGQEVDERVQQDL